MKFNRSSFLTGKKNHVSVLILNKQKLRETLSKITLLKRSGNAGNIFLQLVSQHYCIAVESTVARITTFVTNLIQRCKPAEFYTYIVGQSSVNKDGSFFHIT